MSTVLCLITRPAGVPSPSMLISASGGPYSPGGPYSGQAAIEARKALDAAEPSVARAWRSVCPLTAGGLISVSWPVSATGQGS